MIGVQSAGKKNECGGEVEGTDESKAVELTTGWINTLALTTLLRKARESAKRYVRKRKLAKEGWRWGFGCGGGGVPGGDVVVW
jgi:hypothetical protein